jgi:hypothetical protein
MEKLLHDIFPEAYTAIVARVKVSIALNTKSDQYGIQPYLKEDFEAYLTQSRFWKMDDPEFSFVDYLRSCSAICDRELTINLLSRRVRWYTFFLKRTIKRLVTEVLILKEAVGIGNKGG